MSHIAVYLSAQSLDGWRGPDPPVRKKRRRILFPAVLRRRTKGAIIKISILKNGEQGGGGMGGIVEKAFYEMIGNTVFVFVLVPVGLIFLGYIIFIVVEMIREIRKK